MVFIVRDSLKASRPLAQGKIVKAEDFWAFREVVDAVADGIRERDALIEAAREAYMAEQHRGYKDGVEAAKREQAGNMIEIICHTIQYFAKVENRMADLVLDAVRRIIGGLDERERVMAVVRQSLALVRTEKHLTLRVNSSHVEVVRAEMVTLLRDFPAVEYVDVAGDEHMAEDACLIESDIGIVEGHISGQIEVLRASFEKVLGASVAQ